MEKKRKISKLPEFEDVSIKVKMQCALALFDKKIALALASGNMKLASGLKKQRMEAYAKYAKDFDIEQIYRRRVANRQFGLAAQVRAVKLWNLLRSGSKLNVPLTKQERENLAAVGEYLKWKYIGRETEGEMDLSDPKGKIIKTLKTVDARNVVFSEKTSDGDAFWIDVGNGIARVDGKAVLTWDNVPAKIPSGYQGGDYWTLYEYASDGSYVMTKMAGPVMTKIHHDKYGKAFPNTKAVSKITRKQRSN